VTVVPTVTGRLLGVKAVFLIEMVSADVTFESAAGVALAVEPGAGGVWVALIFLVASLAVPLDGFKIELNPRCKLQEDKSMADMTSKVKKAKRFILYFLPEQVPIDNVLFYFCDIRIRCETPVREIVGVLEKSYTFASLGFPGLNLEYTRSG
jgi:hypothetical protein